MNENKCAAVLIGPPGSGKTTVVRALTARQDMSVIEAGNLLEAEVRKQSSLGQRIPEWTSRHADRWHHQRHGHTNAQHLGYAPGLYRAG